MWLSGFDRITEIPYETGTAPCGEMGPTFGVASDGFVVDLRVICGGLGSGALDALVTAGAMRCRLGGHLEGHLRLVFGGI